MTEPLDPEPLGLRWSSLREFFNAKVKVKFILPPFLFLGLAISVALFQVGKINEDRSREAAVKVYEQCLISHDAGVANKALQQSIVDSTALISTSIHSIIAAATAQLPVDPTTALSVSVAKTLDDLDAQIAESQAKVNAIKIRNCDPLKPADYTSPSVVG